MYQGIPIFEGIPHGKASGSTGLPLSSAIRSQRSPKAPACTARKRRREPFRTHASMSPDELQVERKIGASVASTVWRFRMIRSPSAVASGDRCAVGGVVMRCRVSARTSVGPGMKRRGCIGRATSGRPNLAGSDSTGKVSQDNAISVGMANDSDAYYINYAFTAVEGQDLVITLTQNNDNYSWHLYGLTNQALNLE